jgi:hypothetical protein
VNEEDRYKRLEVLRQQAAETLRLPLNAEKTILLSALRLSHEIEVERLLAGAKPDPGSLLALSEAIDRLTPALPPASIQIEFVEPTDGPLVPHCRRCGWKPGDDLNMPHAPPTPSTIDGEAVKPQPQVQQNVVALPNRGGSHDAPGARMAGPSYGFCTGTDSNNPFSAGTRPAFESAHPLPSPNWDVLPH